VEQFVGEKLTIPSGDLAKLIIASIAAVARCSSLHNTKEVQPRREQRNIYSIGISTLCICRADRQQLCMFMKNELPHIEGIKLHHHYSSVH